MRSDGTIEPLGDISSSDEHYAIDDNEPIFKIIKNLSEKTQNTRRNQRIRKSAKQPSRFFLFSRMKHVKYQQKSQDWTFSELCRITHTSWDNIQPCESEELDDTIDQRIQEYRDMLLNFRNSLLPDSSGRLKYKSWVSAAAATKEHPPVQQVTTTATTTAALSSPSYTTKDPATPAIPERLHNLAGKASVYHATGLPNKSNTNARHSLFSYRSTTAAANNNDYSSETGLNYVANANATSIDSCGNEACSNKPVQDHRWDGQYCSARCLISDCRDAFNSWLAERGNERRSRVVTNGKSRSSSLTGGDNIDEEEEEEIMQYLASPATEELQNQHHGEEDGQNQQQQRRRRLQSESDDEDDSISCDENLFASLQQHYFPDGPTAGKVVDITHSDDDEEEDDDDNNRRVKQHFSSANDYINLMTTDIDDDSPTSRSPLKLHHRSVVVAAAAVMHSSPDLCSSSQCTSVAISSHSEG